jgi:hypothetical protein
MHSVYSGVFRKSKSARLIPCVLWDIKIHCRFQKSPPMDPMLNVMNHIQILIIYCTDIDFNLMFCWPCIIVYQYNETNVMHFSLNLLRIKGLYMFRALVALPQEALHGCSETATVPQPTDIIRTQYTKCWWWSASWGWRSNARNMYTYRPLILNKLNEKYITLFSLCRSILILPFHISLRRPNAPSN